MRTTLFCVITQRVSGYIREVEELQLHPNHMNRDDSLTQSRSWKPLLCILRESRQPPQQPSLWPFQGSLHLSSFLTQKVSFSPSPFYSRTPYQILFSPGPGQLTPLLFLNFHFVCFTSISTVILFLPSPFLYYLPISSPFPFSFFSLLPFMPFLYYSDISCPVLLYLGLVPRDYNPPLNFSVTELFIVLISFLHQIFPCPSICIIMFLGLPALYMVILPWISTRLRHLPCPLFFLFYFAIYYHFLCWLLLNLLATSFF